MPSIQYQLDPEYVGAFDGGVIHVDDARDYDVAAALIAGSGTITVVDTDLALINALDAYLPLHRSGTTGGPPGYVPPPALPFRRIRLGLGSATDETTLEIQHDADVYPRFAIDAEGDLFQGPGSTAPSPVALALAPIVSAPTTSSGTLVANKHTPVDATAGPKTMALPTGQAAGARISVEKYDTSTNAVSITGNVRGLSAQTVTLVLPREAIELIADASGSWWPVAGHKTLSSLDARYAFPTDVEVDLCRPPYNCAPGADITAALQQAINDNVVAGSAVTLYFSKHGTYNLNGAQQSGTVSGRAYSGQIVFPAIPWSGASATVKIKGLGQASPYSPLDAGRVLLLSNATSGKVADVIPAGAGSYPTYSNLFVILENIITQVPSDPQCSGWDLGNAWQKRVERSIVTQTSYAQAASTLTGSGTGLNLTGSASFTGTTPIVRDVQVLGFPKAFGLTDHTAIEGDCFVTNCATVFTGFNANPAHIEHVHCMGCQTVFAPSGGTLLVNGTIAWEATGATAAQFANDPNGLLQADVQIKLQGDTPTSPSSLPGVFGGSSTWSASNIASPQNKQGCLDAHPVDTFARVLPAPANSGNPGMCSDTHHPWRVQQGAFSLAAQTLQAATAPAQALVPCKRGRYGAETRVVTAVVTTASSGYDLYVQSGYQHGSGSHLSARLFNGNVYIYIGGSFKAFLTGAVAGSTTYTVALVVTVNHKGRPVRARVLLNDVEKLDYALTAAESNGLGPGAQYPYLEDGILLNDTSSTCTAFNVRGATMDDLVTRNPYVAFAQSGGGTWTPDATGGTWQTATVADATAFTIAAPVNGPTSANNEKSLTQQLTVEIFNNTAGALGAITWNATYVFAGQTWTSPAAGKKRYARFQWNGSAWVCIGVAAADY